MWYGVPVEGWALDLKIDHQKPIDREPSDPQICGDYWSSVGANLAPRTTSFFPIQDDASLIGTRVTVIQDLRDDR